MSNFARQAPRPAILINSTACSMSWYLRENSSRGIKLLILGIVELWGEDKSMISRFLPENFLVAMPMGLMRKILKGGSSKGPIMKPDLTSFAMRSFTVSGSARADWRLLQMWFWGERAFDTGVEALNEAEQKVFAELPIRMVGEFGGQTRNVHRSR